MKIKYQINEQDKEMFSNIVKPKLESGKRPELLCSFTYITANYTVLFVLKQLAEFAKQGYNIRLLIWDMNSLTHQYSRDLKDKNTSFIKEKIKEIRSIARSLGVKDHHLRIYKSSETWKRLITISKPKLFFDFYELLTDFKVEDLGEVRKVSHLVQMPADIFMANYFHLLYPEEVQNPIDVVFLGRNKEKIYRAVKEKMFEKGLINIERPILFLPPIYPYLIYNNKVPEWNMKLDEIIYLISSKKPSLTEIKQMFESVLPDLSEFMLVADGKKKKVAFNILLTKLAKLEPRDLYLTLSENLYIYLQDIKKNIGTGSGLSNIMNISEKERAIEIGKVLKSEIALDILLLSNGKYNATQIARKLKKQTSNVGVYVNNLKKLRLIELTPNRSLKRTVKGFNMNFDGLGG